MVIKDVDVAIIGTGTAGMGAYREARKHTDSIALIEGGEYGTTCARVGCMPSKLLIAAADSAYHANHTELFGVNVPRVDVDGKAVLKRVRRERDRFVGFVLEDVEGFDAKHKLRGYARFKDDHTLLIDSHTEVRAKRIVIATGSRPYIADVLEKAGKRLVLNDEIFELEDLPKSVLVSGTGVIGLELGQALNRLGVNVTMVARSDSIGGIVDYEIKAYAGKTFASEFDLQLHTQIKDVLASDEYIDVVLSDKEGKETTKRVDYVLAATGRVSNTDKLDLSNTSLSLDAKGVPDFNSQTMQTSVPHIFIAGDANNELPLLHEASDEGRIAGKNAGCYPNVELGKRRAHLGVVFSDPQIASIGLRQNELESVDFVVGQVSFENQGRSRVMGINKGILKVYANKNTGVFLGAEMFGPAAEHVGHLLSWAAQQGLSVAEILDMPFYHPVIEEGVRTAFRDVSAKLSLA